MASQCVTVVGLGRLSGKYYIDSITHHVGNGYTMDLELSLVEAMTEEVIKDATERLAAVGVMASPEYWVAHYKDVKNLDGLILNMATRIKVNLGGTSITTVDAALDVLTKTGVINSPGLLGHRLHLPGVAGHPAAQGGQRPDGGLRRTIWQMKFSGWARFHPLTTPPGLVPGGLPRQGQQRDRPPAHALHRVQHAKGGGSRHGAAPIQRDRGRGWSWAGIGPAITNPRRARRACSARTWAGRRGRP